MKTAKVPVSMKAEETDVETSGANHLGMERLIFFSDAVFAIAITLLALDIRLPPGSEGLNDSELFLALLGLTNQYLAYLLSFLVIGSFWIGHHRKFRFIKRYDSRLLLLNLLFLSVIAFVPFPTSVISAYGNRTATIFYAITMVLAGLLFIALWQHALQKNLIEKSLDLRTRQREFIAPLIFVLVFLLSIGVAFINENLAKFFWLIFLPISLYVNNR
jgi:uncharacterized membrane protein